MSARLLIRNSHKKVYLYTTHFYISEPEVAGATFEVIVTAIESDACLSMPEAGCVGFPGCAWDGDIVLLVLGYNCWRIRGSKF